MSSTHWNAVIKVKIPTGGQSSAQDPAGNWRYENVRTDQIIKIAVPDLGGFFTTKASLENVYGQGSVLGLSH